MMMLILKKNSFKFYIIFLAGHINMHTNTLPYVCMYIYMYIYTYLYVRMYTYILLELLFFSLI